MSEKKSPESEWDSILIDDQVFWYPLRHSKLADMAKRGVYESEMTAYLLGTLTPDMTFFDVGAHYGYYTLLAAKRVKRVVAFEPREKARRVLEANIEANAYDNVTVAFYPLFRENVWGRMVLSQFKEDPQGYVFARSLDSLDVGIPDVIKIDVEGAECDVLLGASQTLKAHRPHIAIELHCGKDQTKDYHCDLERLEEILSGLGYVMKEVGESSKSEIYLVAEPR